MYNTFQWYESDNYVANEILEKLSKNGIKYAYITQAPKGHYVVYVDNTAMLVDECPTWNEINSKIDILVAHSTHSWRRNSDGKPIRNPNCKQIGYSAGRRYTFRNDEIKKMFIDEYKNLGVWE